MTLELDQHDVLSLIKYAWSYRSIHCANLLTKAVDQWYYRMHPSEREFLFAWWSENGRASLSSTEPHYHLKRHFMARFDPANQYQVTTSAGLEATYLLDGEHYVSSAVRIDRVHIQAAHRTIR